MGKKSLVAELDVIEKEGDINTKLSERVSRPENIDELKTILDWLRLRVLKGQGGARYAYLYANCLWKANIKDTAVAMYLYGCLKARVDAAYCADVTASSKITNWEFQLAPIKSYLFGLKSDQIQKLLQIAIDLEDKNKDSGKDEWLCSGGTSFFEKYFEKHGAKLEGAKETDSPEHIGGGKVIVLSDKDIKPEFIDKSTWQQKRVSIIENFKQSLSNDNYSASQLTNAIIENDIQKATQLISEGANMSARNKDGCTPLLFALGISRGEIAKMLIDKGADVNAKENDGDTTLHEAAFLDKTEIAKMLIDKGVDVNAKNNNGGTPLYNAVFKGNVEMVKMLIDKGADVNARETLYGNTILIHAETPSKNSVEITKMLIDKGADVNAKDNSGYASLDSAALYGKTEMVRLLVDKGADVNTKGNDGRTPLIASAYKGKTEIAKMLIDKGADVNAQDLNGKTALSIAQEKNHNDMVQLLRQFGAI